jgi:hypothetical protein
MIKKRVKYREKQKKKEAILREELMLKENGFLIPIKEIRLKELPDIPQRRII